jgi:uncharacterized repeat protein (TIGR01451 family)
MLMAKWFVRGMSVLGVAALAWASHGIGQSPVSATPKGMPSAAATAPPAQPASLDRQTRGRVVETLARQPLRFEANAGQFADGVRFAARGTGYGVALTGTGATLSLTSKAASVAVAMTVVGADGAPAAARRVDGRDALPGVVNHYIGTDRSRWRSGVRQFARVRQAGVYEGIDLEFYGNQQRLEYDFLVAPGADPSAIRLRFDGADRIAIDEAGDLLVHAAAGEPLRQQAPISYQVIDGTRQEVESRYVRLAANEVGVALGAYDRAHALTIDPVLIYSSFFGGSSQENAYDIALDPAGSIYLTGQTTAGAGFPTTPGAQQPTKPGLSDAFVAKFNPAGTALIYSTFLGGTNNENTRTQRSGRIAVDAVGNAYIAGDTSSTDFPVGGSGADTVFGGGAAGQTDAFYVKLGPTGAFLYGTYMGGIDYDTAVGIGVDSTGNVYVAGSTLSDAATFPQTANGYDQVRTGYDAFLTKFNASGTRVYSTFLGGSGGDNYNVKAGGLAVDDQGRAYLTGDTYSTDFPVVGGYQATFSGPSGYDAFLAVIDTTLSGVPSLVYSTYLGGSGADIPYGIAYAGSRQVVIVGETGILSAPFAAFPTKNPYDATFNGVRDAFVARFDTSLTGNASLVFSTYLGGSDYEYANDVAVDLQGAIHVVGDVRSTDFPLVNPVSTGFDFIGKFVTKMNATGTVLLYSTYFGGVVNGVGAFGVATNAAGDTYITGATNNPATNPPTATGFPIVSPFQGVYGGGNTDAFIARLGNGADLLLTKTASPEPVSTNGTLTYTLTIGNLSADPALNVTLADPLPAGVTFATCVANAGGVCGGSGNDRTVTFASIAGLSSATVTITATVTAGMGATLVNTAAVASSTFDPVTANNTATATSHTPGANPNDTDNDALPNDWETRFGLDPASGSGDNGPGGDPDGDGRTNFQELQDGSHPRGFVITYLAEGATGTFFDTRIALANPTASTAHVLCRYQKDNGTVVSDYRSMVPFSRLTIDVDGVASMADVAFSSLIEADVQVVADRTMTWGTGGYGSHAERGVLTRSATAWYLAEGATHGSFDLFYLIQNPGAVAAAVEIAYLLPAPAAPVIRSYTIAPNSRQTIRVDDVPGLAATDVSAAIRATNSVPIIVERAMYFTRPDQVYAAGHESAGVTAPQTRWFLAEGATGSFFNMFVLIANPSADAATVQLDYLLTNGQTVTRTHTVAANSRLTLNVAEEAPELVSANMSTVATSTNAVPIVVERAMWWPAPGNNWQEAHNSPGEIVTGSRWAVAEGESGGANGTQTYLLIANTSTFVGSARVTLMFEDGTTLEKVFALPASSRTNVSVDVEFPTAFGRRFGALIETQGGTPAQIVVERAMYANANGIIWAAGTNALATKLQ